jgi:ATP-binding cassette, subfamily B, bacterial
MVLRFHGRHISVAEVTSVLPPDYRGTDAAALIKAAQLFGLKARAANIDIQALPDLPAGSILHWRFRHFVVFERVRKVSVDIVDPSFGRRALPQCEFAKYFTGVALMFEPTETFLRTSQQPRNLFRWVKQIPVSKSLLIGIALSSLFIQLALAIVPILLRSIIDRVVPYSDTTLLTKVFAIYCISQSFVVLSTFIRSYLLVQLRANVEAEIGINFVNRFIQPPYSFTKYRASSDLLSRLTGIKDILTSAASSTILDSATASLYGVLLFFVNPQFALLAVAQACVRTIVLVIWSFRQKTMLNRTFDKEVDVQICQVELFSGIETLKSMGLEGRAADQWRSAYLEGLNTSIERSRLDAAFVAILGVLKCVGTSVFLFYGTYMVLKQQLSLGLMAEIALYSFALLDPLDNIIKGVAQFQLIRVYLDRLNDVMDAPPEPANLSAHRSHLIRGNITLGKVSFAHSIGGPQAVSDISVHIEAGWWVALVGQSGSGRSTLARLLAGLLIPAKGTIMFDGQKLESLDRHAVRTQIGFVTQDMQLFSGSIRKNIGLSDPGMDLARIVEAAKLACIHDDIMQMPMGYETPLSDRKLSLSGGQRQRLALARALANDPSILILDEATSYLDEMTEHLVNASLGGLQCTRIVIPHRLNTIRNADLILVMREGYIVEAGSHRDLISLRGHYYHLAQ